MILPTKVESKKIERQISKIKCRSIKISKDKNIEKKKSKYQNVKTLGIRNNLREKIEKDV
jgi:hypothetical protein